jgi:hypothetical protein
VVWKVLRKGRREEVAVVGLVYKGLGVWPGHLASRHGTLTNSAASVVIPGQSERCVRWNWVRAPLREEVWDQ